MIPEAKWIDVSSGNLLQLDTHNAFGEQVSNFRYSPVLWSTVFMATYFERNLLNLFKSRQTVGNIKM